MTVPSYNQGHLLTIFSHIMMVSLPTLKSNIQQTICFCVCEIHFFFKLEERFKRKREAMIQNKSTINVKIKIEKDVGIWVSNIDNTKIWNFQIHLKHRYLLETKNHYVQIIIFLNNYFFVKHLETLWEILLCIHEMKKKRQASSLIGSPSQLRNLHTWISNLLKKRIHVDIFFQNIFVFFKVGNNISTVDMYVSNQLDRKKLSSVKICYQIQTIYLQKIYFVVLLVTFNEGF